MSSIHNPSPSRWLGALGLITISAGILAGCQSKPRPFDDVAQRDSHTPTLDTPVVVETPTPDPAQAPATDQPPPAPIAQDQPAAPVDTLVPRNDTSTLTKTGNGWTLTPAPGTETAGAITKDGSGRLVIPSSTVRNWPLAVAYRPSGDVLAGPTYWPLDPVQDRPEWQNALLQPVEFLVNLVMLPVRAVGKPPGSKAVYSSADPADIQAPMNHDHPDLPDQP